MAQFPDGEVILKCSTPEQDPVTGNDISRRFDTFVVDQNLATIDCTGGQAAGFVKTSAPQPLVQAHLLIFISGFRHCIRIDVEYRDLTDFYCK